MPASMLAVVHHSYGGSGVLQVAEVAKPAPRPTEVLVKVVGFGVTTLKPGDEVYGMPRFPLAAGGCAEYATAPSRQPARKPATLSHAQAAAVPPAALTAWQALVDTAKLVRDRRLLVHSLGDTPIPAAEHTRSLNDKRL
jgi:NADPH:quinone reductase-like Zn-dependent oxidoreductase